MEDLVILVDENDSEIGSAKKLEAHQKGLLHRAFSILIFNSKGEMLLQKRALDKYHSGGLWANACCSHPRFGESLDEAIHRRLQEEMGFDCPLEEIFSFIYKEDVGGGLIENEFDRVFKGVYDGEVSPDPEEVADYRWISWEELCDDVEKNPGRYTCWFKKILERLNRAVPLR